MMRWILAAVVACAGMAGVAGQAWGQGNVKLPRYPSISPDGKQVVFSWRGDLWMVSSGGGQAARLTAHPFNDLHSAWSADGKQIAFASDRAGGLNIFVM